MSLLVAIVVFVLFLAVLDRFGIFDEEPRGKCDVPGCPCNPWNCDSNCWCAKRKP